jgi:hypothetical protein
VIFILACRPAMLKLLLEWTERLIRRPANGADQIDAVFHERVEILTHEPVLQLHIGAFGRRPAGELASSLLPHAIECDRLAVLAGIVIQECRQRGIVVPSPRSFERLCVHLRHQARREIERRLIDGLLAEQRRRLDALTERRAESGQS